MFEEKAYCTDKDTVKLEKEADDLMSEMSKLDRMLLEIVCSLDKIVIDKDQRKELQDAYALFSRCYSKTAGVVVLSEKVKRKHIKVTRLPKMFIKES